MNGAPMDDFLQRLRYRAKEFGPELAKLAFQRGLAVTLPDGAKKPIPITATPVIVEAAEIRRRVELTQQLASAGLKMARSILEGPDREVLLGAASPFEREILEKTEKGISRLATARVDYFVAGGKPRALELNTTIPAMQGYSDIAANTFIEVVGRAAGMPDHVIAKVMARNGSNALALYRALLDGYAAERGGAPERIALLCRRNDSQVTELQYLRDRFAEWGADAEIVYPDELSGEDAVMAHGKKFDLVYRHLFVRRLEQIPAPNVVDLLSAPGKRAVVLNPPNAQIEMKATFAFLSEALSERGLARDARLSDNELAAMREALPWTRLLRHGPGVDPDGKKVEDLVARVAGEPERFVLKRSWEYGGKAVFIGRAMSEPSFEERSVAAYGAKLAWPELCARAAEDKVGGGFVVQEVVAPEPEGHVLCTLRQAQGGAEGVADVDLHVDFSAYASVGLARQPAWGGVCRGSPSQIVNIVGGGGVLPLVTSDVAKSLYDAMLAWGRF